MSTSKRARRLAFFAAAVIVIALGVTASVTVRSQKDNPSTQVPAGPAPSRVLATKNRKIPQVTAANARESVLAFVDFAGNAGMDQREEIRKALDSLRDNGAAVEVFCDEAFKAQKEDHSRALLILSLLGEIRSADGAKCLARFMQIPFPRTGTKVDGEIIEQTALGTLQAKAIDGLAYMNGDYDKLVLDAAKGHPSIIVRAEAIEAYLWNHRNNAADARKTVGAVVRKGEEIYLDRVRRDTGESKESFNQKLEAFLRAHPEAVPPKPEPENKIPNTKDGRPGRVASPPKF
jgi:hypothetical protein